MFQIERRRDAVHEETGHKKPWTIYRSLTYLCQG